MNPSSGEGAPQHNFELPKPPETHQLAGGVEADNALERSAPDENRVGKQQPPLTAPVMPLALPSDQTQIADDSAASPTPHKISDDDAKDGDMIEKVWINKAKTIIARSHDDPFVQKKEMSRVKADYIQKRFNKTIPVDDN